MEVHIVCGSRNPCGFRVHSEYFRDKPRFAPGICPRCNGPLAYVEAYTETIIPTASMSMLEHHRGGGAVLGIPSLPSTEVAPVGGDI